VVGGESDYRIEVTDAPSEADARFVVRRLVQFNDAQAECECWRSLGIFMRGGDGAIAAGLVGHTHWGWLFVSHLWVAEPLRGRGYGSELVRRAEREAVRRGCKHAHLDTFDFQARGFYERLGYAVFGALPDFPVGHTLYFLSKPLADQPSP
jgi:GNAT superfamily N-acetyltransferase